MSVETKSKVVDTKKVTGRRKLHFDSVDEILADPERLAEKGYRKLGNWSLGQIAKHLAKGMRDGLDGADYKPFWLVSFVAKNFLKKRLLSKTFSPGLKPSARITAKTEYPPATDQEGLDALREVINRWKSESQRHAHAFFGPLSDEEWDQESLRHAELHMSFLVPIG